MDGLAPEQRPIAERLAAAAGSLPALRKAIADEQAKAKLEGRPFDGGEQILAIAEQLHPDVKAALWMDRAEAAVQHVDELSLRDLRAIVVAGAPRTDEGRELERALREALDRRVSKLRSDWEEHLTQALGEGRVLQALRLSARPPEPTARFPAGLVEGLAAQTSAAMNAETSPDRWLALLGAAELSPVKRQIRPAGIPEDPSGELHRKAAEAAGRIPALAGLLGMAMPPPPQPLPGERPVRPHPPRPPRPRAMGGGRPPRPRPAAGAPEQSPAVSATPETTQATAPMETPPPPVAEDTVASAPQPETVASTPESDTVASSPGADVVVSAPEPDSVTSPPDPDTLASAPEPETVASAPEPASSSSDSVGDTSDRAPDDTVVDQPVE